MTWDKFWSIVTGKFMWASYWNGEEVTDETKREILNNSLLIPKPKFKVGDRVWSKINGLELTQCTITSSMYCFERKEWGYGVKDYSNEKYQETVHYTYHLANWESAYRLVDPENESIDR